MDPFATANIPERGARTGYVSALFKHCVGAIDGTHVQVRVRLYDQSAYRRRKGYTSQNVMMCVDHQCRVRFLLVGWEGSTHESRVLRDARGKGFLIPRGKYVVADAGYGESDTVLTPYRRVRCHLSSWEGPNGERRRPRKPQELFNYMHAQLRNVAERTFGQMKMKWATLQEIPRYSPENKTKTVVACSVLHNMRMATKPVDSEPYPVPSCDPFSPASHGNMRAFRDWIAHQMWARFSVTVL